MAAPRLPAICCRPVNHDVHRQHTATFVGNGPNMRSTSRTIAVIFTHISIWGYLLRALKWATTSLDRETNP